MAEHESYAALASQVAEMRAELAGQGTALEEIRTSLATFGARLDTETGPVMVLQAGHKRLNERLDALQRQVEEIAAAVAGDGGSDQEDEEPVIIRWDRGTKEELRERLEEMRGWVGNVLRRQYSGYLGGLKKCWPEHVEVLWELSTLKAEYERVFGDEKVTLTDAQWWHERWLPGFRARVLTAMHGCDGGRCTARPTQTGPAGPGTRARPRPSDPISAAFKDIPRRPY